MQNRISPAVASLIVVVMIGIATLAVAKLNNATSDAPAIAHSTSNQLGAPTTTRSTLKDGVFTTKGTYSTPGGAESINLTVILKNDIIVNVELQQNASRGDSAIYQAKFASGYKPFVQGKDIKEIKLTRVAGSSLTSDGFNQAIENIRRDAAL